MISLDLETTGLDPRRHEAWEVGLAQVETVVATDPHAFGEYAVEFPVQDLGAAESAALEISGYYRRSRLLWDIPVQALDRHGVPAPPGPEDAVRFGSGQPIVTTTDGQTYSPGLPARDAALQIARLTDGQRLMGCAIQFDMAFLTALLERYEVRPCWHHRALDLGSWCAGVDGKPEPYSSRAMADRIPNEEAHTALGDAKWNVEVYNFFREKAE